VKTAADVLVGFIAVEHLWFLVLEMFLWTTPFGRKTFGLDAEFATKSAPLAMNQGLYNGFLVAGLVWGLVTGAWAVKVFFVACVLVAGVFGGITVKRAILILQGTPAAIGLALLLLTRT
jgi:putative membrane protein